MDFSTTFFNVLMVLIYALPGFILVKTKLASASHLKTISTILVYVFSPCMILSAFQGVSVTKKLTINILLFLGISTFIQVLMIVLYFIVFRLIKKIRGKKYDEEGNEIPMKERRLGIVAVALGNVGFFGLPIINALLPDYSEAKIYSTIFCLTMNFIVFTLGAYAATGDKKYMSVKQAILNPTTISAIFAAILYAFDIKISNLFGSFGPILNDGVILLGKMTTPVCMLILGMRLGAIDLKHLFTDWTVYLFSFIKMIIFPLLSYLLVYFIPGLDYGFKASILILCAAPMASMILNIAEMLGSEQEYASKLVLISTLLSIITIPLVVLVL